MFATLSRKAALLLPIQENSVVLFEIYISLYLYLRRVIIAKTLDVSKVAKFLSIGRRLTASVNKWYLLRNTGFNVFVTVHNACKFVFKRQLKLSRYCLWLYFRESVFAFTFYGGVFLL